MRMVKTIVILALLVVTFYYGIILVLDAAIGEQDFNDNIHRARCERMDEHTRAYMKGYCVFR